VFDKFRVETILIPFRTLFHADWSAGPKSRFVCTAERTADGWTVMPPRLVGDTADFVDTLFNSAGPSLAGFDFPIGLPVAYGQIAGLTDFPAALEVFGLREWAEFFAVAELAEQVSPRRPFYPRLSKAGVKQGDLVSGLGVATFDQLLRRCDRPTSTRRRPACSMFWTLGPSQVGKAAIAGWREIIMPARRRGARLWPFDGALAELAGPRPVIAETYPADAYRQVELEMRGNMSKLRQGDRHEVMVGLCDRARQHGITFSPELCRQVAEGFGARRDGDDAFDALIGLLGMIEVVDGRRVERPVHRGASDDLEGWILGQSE